MVNARRQLLGGVGLADEGGLVVTGLVPPDHKLATRVIAASEAVRRYNQVIGHATQVIAPGQHVHTHNLVAYTARNAMTMETTPRPATRPAG